MASLTAQQYLDKWKRRLDAATTDIQAGVDKVTTAPGELAAQAQDRMLAGIQQSIANGSWQRGVRSVSLQQWKDSMKNKGVNRIAAGTAQAVQTKVQSIQNLLTAVDAASAAANALPKGGLEQGIARATTFMREMSKRAPKNQQS